MIITNDELIQLVWLNQLRRLSSSVLDIGNEGKFWLTGGHESNYLCAIKESREKRCVVTTLLPQPYLWTRLKQLQESGLLNMDGQRCVFWLDGDCSRSAWRVARNFWRKRGVKGHPNPANRIPRKVFEDWAEQCRDLLLAKFSGAYAPVVQQAA
ncbi:hypothetical protein ACJJJB_00155 (plasmid) [Microbulbifer sp. ANSA001]|uniref:hypothetical protein n=1 Tax=Microbulbifer sp. ANSA001 TaxID=3243358 RepID=UPI004042A2DC